MPDPVVPNDQPAATAPSPPAPAAQPQPSPPAKPPAAPAGTPATVPPDEIRPETVIEYFAKDGAKRYATIRDLVDIAESDNAKISPEELERLRTVERGLSGDQDAARKMLEMFIPGLSGQPKSEQPQDPVAALRAEMQEMMKPAVALAQQVEEQRMTSGCAALVEQWKEKVPYLAKHPEAGNIVLRRVEAANATIKAAGQDPARLPKEEQYRIIASAMREADNEIRNIAQLFGVAGLEPPKPNPAQNVQVTNDQNQPGVEAGVIPSRYYVDPQTGMLVDRRGAPVSQTPHGATIPGEIPNPTAAGGHVAGTVPAAKMPMTREQTLELMRARKAEMNAQ